MTHKKKTYGHQLGPMTHFLTTPKFDLLLYIGEKCAKKPYFYHFFWKKEVKLERNKKKNCCGHQLRTMTYFSKYHTFDPLLYLGCQMLWTHFFFYFFCENRSNHKIFGKKYLRASTRTHDPFFDNQKFDLLLYIGEKCLQTHLQSFLCAS